MTNIGKRGCVDGREHTSLPWRVSDKRGRTDKKGTMPRWLLISSFGPGTMPTGENEKRRRRQHGDLLCNTASPPIPHLGSLMKPFVGICKIS